MSLSGMLTALVEYVGQVIVDECALPAPGRVLRYHGDAPADCPADGQLSVSWERLYPTVQFPASSSTAREPCAGYPMFVANVLYLRCWKIPEADETGVALEDTRWDADSAILADVAECVSRAIIRLSCAPSVDPFAKAVTDRAPRAAIRLLECTPIMPSGDSAGVRWKAYVGLTGSEPVS